MRETERMSDGRGRPRGGKATDGKGETEVRRAGVRWALGEALLATLGGWAPGQSPLPRGRCIGAERGQVSHLQKHWLPIGRNCRRRGEQRGTHSQRGREGRGRGEEGCWGGKEAPGQGGVWTAGGEGAWPRQGSVQLFRGTGERGGKDQGERETGGGRPHQNYLIK